MVIKILGKFGEYDSFSVKQDKHLEMTPAYLKP